MTTGHNITLTPGWNTIGDLQREGWAWGEFMAAQAFGLIKLAATIPPGSSEQVDALIDRGIGKDWKGTMQTVVAILPPQQVKTFETAARAAFSVRLAEIRRGPP